VATSIALAQAFPVRPGRCGLGFRKVRFWRAFANARSLAMNFSTIGAFNFAGSTVLPFFRAMISA
jgi:hypothetical protein